MSGLLAAEQLDDADAALLADGDRLGARPAVVDPNVERRPGRGVERDDRARVRRSRRARTGSAGSAELDGELERDVVEQGLERLRIEGVVVE
jgi:hypothetical protein